MIHNMKINKWTITQTKATNRWGITEYLCICDCGTERYQQLSTLTTNRSKGCMNCTRSPIERKYNKWTIIDGPEKNRHKQLMYKVKCVCGYERYIRKWSLIKGTSTSCNKCSLKENPKRALTHGFSRTKIYRVWCDMKSRCLNINHKKYKNYGGRGIKICQGWNKFVCFLKDMGPVPFGMQLGRRDVNKDYTPENTIWTTPKESMNNRSNCRQKKQYN